MSAPLPVYLMRAGCGPPGKRVHGPWLDPGG
jgi:hypothetical protein